MPLRPGHGGRRGVDQHRGGGDRSDVSADVKLSANWMAAGRPPGRGCRLYETVRAVGMELCPALGIAIPVGKDSMSMKTVWQHRRVSGRDGRPLSLIVSAFAPVVDVRRTLTPQLRARCQATPTLVLIDLGRGSNRLGVGAGAGLSTDRRRAGRRCR